jgi:hypothetical protein
MMFPMLRLTMFMDTGRKARQPPLKWMETGTSQRPVNKYEKLHNIIEWCDSRYD